MIRWPDPGQSTSCQGILSVSRSRQKTRTLRVVPRSALLEGIEIKAYQRLLLPLSAPPDKTADQPTGIPQRNIDLVRVSFVGGLFKLCAGVGHGYTNCLPYGALVCWPLPRLDSSVTGTPGGAPACS